MHRPRGPRTALRNSHVSVHLHNHPWHFRANPTNMVAEHCFAEQVELHDEMAEYMQRVSEQPAELSVEEQKEQT